MRQSIGQENGQPKKHGLSAKSEIIGEALHAQ